MTEITKEWLEGRLSTVATKADLTGLATKADLQDLKTELVARMDDSQAQLAAMTKRGFDDLGKRLDVRDQVETLKQQMREVREELNLA